MSVRISQVANLSWTTIGTIVVANPAAGSYNEIAPQKPGVFYQLMAYRMQLPGSLYAAAAGTYDLVLVAYNGVPADTSPLVDTFIALPAAAPASPAGSLYDTGWLRYDPVGLGSIALLGYGIYWYTPEALTGNIAIQFAYNALNGV
ncbi:MAG: hypothetical protein ACYCVW_16685 [Rhodocyclaceae bacterium]